MNEYTFSVNLGGMIDILSNHLYSSPKIFLRELLQNSADAISLRKNLEPGFSSPLINITVEERRSLTFTDNGSGLTEDEIHKFISVIGQSSKRSENSSFIGRFGIGLLSCFIVTDEIILRSRSAKLPERVLEWHGFSDGNYSVKEIESDMEIGTEIFIRALKKHEELFTFEEILKNIRYYGLPIPYPVCISSSERAAIRANSLFERNSGDERTNILEMGKRIFGTDHDYLDYIPLNSKKGLFSGAAYILPFTVSAASNSRHRIYLKNMLLTEDGSSILPEWAFFVQCFFNTDKLRPTASREDFYKDSLLQEAREEISQCISAYLERISIQNPALLAKIVSLHGIALKSVASENERLFKIFMPYFRFETSLGSLSGKTLMRYDKTIFCTQDIDTFRQLRPIFAEKDELLVNMGYVHEKALMEMLDSLGPAHTESLSGDLLENMLEDADEPDNYYFMLSIFSETLDEYGCRVQVKSFSPEQLATVYSTNPDGELKRDIMRSKETAAPMFSDMLDAFEEEIEDEASAALYLNSRNSLIRRLSAVSDKEKLTVFSQILYVQSLIAGGFPMHGAELSKMNNSLIKLIEWGI